MLSTVLTDNPVRPAPIERIRHGNIAYVWHGIDQAWSADPASLPLSLEA